MAFEAVAGYGNLPNGFFAPTIFAKKAQIAFRKTSVVSAITNSDYIGLIKGEGDSVVIRREPEIVVGTYKRGQSLTSQNLDDEKITLTIDKANQFQFQIDDLEKKEMDINYESLAADRAAYKLRDTMDKEVLEYITTTIPTAQILGSAATPTTIGFGAGAMTPAAALNRLKRWLDQRNVPFENRWFVGDAVFYEMLADESSKLLSADYTGGTNNGILRNGKVTEGKVRGFDLHTSNNLPVAGTGPEATSGSNYGWLIAGHKSAVATAEALNKTETLRSQDSFADIFRGLHVYGRATLRGDALVAIRYHL